MKPKWRGIRDIENAEVRALDRVESGMVLARIWHEFFTVV